MAARTTTREQFYAALFALLSAQTAADGSKLLRASSRRLQQVEDWMVENSPTVYQVQDDQLIFKKNPQLPPTNGWTAQWFVYVGVTDDTAAPSMTLNPVVDGLLALLAPAADGDRNPLGGLVYDVAAEEKVEVFEGLLGSKAVAIIHIRALLGGF